MKWNKRGQLTIDNTINWIILIIVSVVLTPVARSFIDVAIAGTNSTTEILLLNAMLPVYWILLIAVVVYYGRPTQ